MKKIIITLSLITLAGCNSGSDSSSSNNNQNQISGGIPIQVSANSTGVCSNLNSPCVSLNVCDSNGNNCSTINNILVDTGSYGLRVFGNLLSNQTKNALNPILVNNNPVGECVSYGDGSQNWGGINLGIVKFTDSIQTSSIPIQIIDSSFMTAPSNCWNRTTSANNFGYNGVLGVGLYQYDGGSYYSCSQNGCTSILNYKQTNEVMNPIYALPNSNNGLTLSFNNISSSGTNSLTGTLLFGVGTNESNTMNPSNVYSANLSSLGIPMFSSLYNNNNYFSFLDSGTNTLGIVNSGITLCNNPYSDFLCPTSNMNLTIQNENSSGQLISTNINIANMNNLINSGNSVFNNIGSELPNSFNGVQVIDYGLPFFIGKNVQLIYDGKTSNIGNGPAWAW